MIRAIEASDPLPLHPVIHQLDSFGMRTASQSVHDVFGLTSWEFSHMSWSIAFYHSWTMWRQNS